MSIRIPGVTVDVRGDITQLQGDLTRARGLVRQAAGDISNSLNNALAPGQVTSGINSLIRNLSQVQRHAKLTGSELDGLGVDLKEVAHLTGLAGKEFDQLQRKMLENRAAQVTERALAQIQRQTGASAMEMVRLKAKLGDTQGAVRDFGRLAVGQFQSVTDRVFNLRNAVIGLGVSWVAAGFVKTAAAFETLELSLETVTGSARAAQEALAWITTFTQDTPFQLEQVGEAFKKLSAYGLEPTKYLQTLGDTASSMGKTLNDAVEMFADAATGEFERLKEFGVRAKTQGDEVTFSWMQNGQEMSATVAKTQEAITAQLAQIFARFQGGMKKQMDGWDGMMSNLMDRWTLFQKDVMDSGPFQEMKDQLQDFLEYLDTAQGKAQLEDWAEDVGDLFQGAVKAAKGLAPLIKATGQAVNSTLEAFNALPTWMQGSGIVAALLFGKKGSLAVMGSMYVVGNVIDRITTYAEAKERHPEISFTDWFFRDSDEAFQQYVAALDAIQAQTQGKLRPVIEVTKEVGAASQAAGKATQLAYQTTGKALAKHTKERIKLEEQWAKVQEAVRRQGMTATERALAEMQERYQSYYQTLEDYAAADYDTAMKYEELHTKLVEAEAKERLAILQKHGFGSGAYYTEGASVTDSTIEEYWQTAQEMGVEAAKSTEDAWVHAANAAGSAVTQIFSQLIAGGKSGGEVIPGLAAGFTSDVVGSLATSAITPALTSALGTALGTAVAGPLGAMAGAAAGMLVNEALGGLFGDDDTEDRIANARRFQEIAAKVLDPGSYGDATAQYYEAIDQAHQSDNRVSTQAMRQLYDALMQAQRLPWWTLTPGQIGAVGNLQGTEAARYQLYGGGREGESGALHLQQILGGFDWQTLVTGMQELSDTAVDRLGSALYDLNALSASWGLSIEELIPGITEAEVVDGTWREALDQLTAATLVQNAAEAERARGLDELSVVNNKLMRSIQALAGWSEMDEQGRIDLISMMQADAAMREELIAAAERQEEIEEILLGSHKVSQDEVARLAEEYEHLTDKLEPNQDAAKDAATGAGKFKSALEELTPVLEAAAKAARAGEGGGGGDGGQVRHHGGLVRHGGGVIPRGHDYPELGWITRMHSGGLRPDERWVLALAGEYVIQPQAVDHYGLAAMDAINSMSLPKAAMERAGGYLPKSTMDLARPVYRPAREAAPAASSEPALGGVNIEKLIMQLETKGMDIADPRQRRQVARALAYDFKAELERINRGVL